MKKENEKNAWYVKFLQYFPLKMLFLDMLIPIFCYVGLANYGEPLAGLFFAGIWSIGRAIAQGIQKRKISVFTFIAIVFTVVECITFYFYDHLYWLSLAVRSEFYGIAVMGTMFSRKTFIERMVEQSNTTNFTDAFKNTDPYRNCWRYVNAVWGIVYIAKGLFYLYIAPELDLGMAFTFRAVLGWPLDILLIVFSIQFPHKYWHWAHKQGKITVSIVK